jgi:hypothetical protein
MTYRFENSISFRRGLIFTFEEFLHTCPSADAPRADFSYITGAESPVGKYTYSRPTILIDLRPSPEAIFYRFQDSTRNKINHITKNDLCHHQIISNPTENDLRTLQSYFDPFARQFGIQPLQLNYLRALAGQDRLCICYVYDRNEILLTGHIYRISQLRPEMLYSFKVIDPGASREHINFISKANRYSHYCDMLYFRSLGFDVYDFGGVSAGLDSGNVKWMNIDIFKMSFGGQVKVYHNSILYNSLKSRTYLRLKEKKLTATNELAKASTH